MRDRRNRQGRVANRVALDAVVVVGLLLSAVVASVLVPEGPVRVLVALPVLFLLPGYGVTLVVFPGEQSDRRQGGISEGHSGGPAGVGPIERLALSFGLSVVVVPLLALGLSLAGIPFDTLPVLVVVSAFTVVTVAAGVVRRRRAPAETVYNPRRAIHEAVAGVRASRLIGSNRAVDAGLNAVLLLAVVTAVGGLALGIAAPQDGSSFTQVSLLTEDVEGDLAASDYPTELTRNETAELVLSVTNREDATVEYEVIVQLQRVDANGTVTDRTQLTWFNNTVADGATWRARHEIQVLQAGQDQRVAYLVYRGNVPANPTISNAYRSVYFWTDVRAVGGEA